MSKTIFITPRLDAKEARGCPPTCQITGRKPGFGNGVSHSHWRTRRRWSPNIQTKTYYLPSEGRRIRLRVSAKGINVIDRDDIETVVARLRRQNVKI